MAEFIAGKVGYVTIDEEGGTEWAFSKWSYTPRAKILPRNTFVAEGKDVNIAGFIGADVELSGPLDQDNPDFFTVGEVYSPRLGIEEDGPTEFTVPFRVESIAVTNDAEDGPMWVVRGPSTGAFEPSVFQQPE